MTKKAIIPLFFIGLAISIYLIISNLPEITQAFQDWFGDYHIDIESPIPGE